MHAAMIHLVLLVSLSQAPVNAPGQTYKVAFWYDVDQPVSSLKYQVYNLSKGEYNEKAVQGWFRSILENDPKHGAYIREIRTDGFPGLTESDRLASAIQGELKRWADLQSEVSRPMTRRVPITPQSTRSSFSSPPLSSPGGPGSPKSPGNPSIYVNPPRSPFPYPYRSGPR